MKEIKPVLQTEFINGLYHVTSEPGDCTLYDYIVYKDFDEFCFMPCGSSFKFPQRLHYYTHKDFTVLNEETVEMSEYLNCNPHTLMECVRTMIQLHEDVEFEPEEV